MSRRDQDQYTVIASHRFVVAGPYDPHTNKKPLFDVTVFKLNGELGITIQVFQACPGWIDSLDPKYYRLIPPALYRKWDAQRLTAKAFLDQALKQSVSPT